MDRLCNDRGTCDVQGRCRCQPAFSGRACQNTVVPGYIRTTNVLCNGRGSITLTAQRPFRECLEKVSIRSRTGGWVEPACISRVALARKRIYETEDATLEDYYGLPMCICRPGYSGIGCENGCPIREDGVPCSGYGNTSVGFLANDTSSGNGCQCSKPVSLATLMPLLNQDQRREVIDDFDTFSRGICARVVRTNLTRTFIVPDVKYECFCDERHYGEVCEFGWCPEGDDGKFCSGNGHTSKGFGAEFNSTRNVSVYGMPGKPLCKVGSDGCCYENTQICAIKEPKCPSDRPYRCSTNKKCVGVPKVQRCDVGWEYGYWDNPMMAPRQKIDSPETVINSPLRYWKFRIVSAQSLKFTLSSGLERVWDGQGEFWSGVESETIDDIESRAFADTGYLPVTVSNIPDTVSNIPDKFVEFYPAPFLNGDEDFDKIVRLVSVFGNYTVVDVSSSRVEIDDSEGTHILANLTADSYLIPGGQVVDTETCVQNIRECAWTEDFVSVDGSRRLCEVDGSLWSTNMPACDPVQRPLKRATTVAFGRSRKIVDWGNFQWRVQEFVGAFRSITLTVESDGEWEAEILTMDDLRKPCICEPPVAPATNQSLWNQKWISEDVRPTGSAVGQRVVAAVDSFGDVQLIRGRLMGDGTILSKHNEVFPFLYTKAVSKSEYERGIPNPNDFVWPVRCPDGDAAKISIWKKINATRTFDCIAQEGRNVDCGDCTCDATQCKCPSEPESEKPLFQSIQGKFDEVCSLTRGNKNVTALSYRTETAVCFVSQTFTTPLEFKVDYPPTKIMGRFAKGYWVDIDMEIEGSVVRPIVTDLDRPFDEWCLVNSTSATPVWTPAGVSLFRTVNYTLSASENAQDLDNVVWNDYTTWKTTDKGWIRIDFAKPVRITGLSVVFETVGFHVDDELGNAAVSVNILSGQYTSRNDARIDWEFVSSLVSSVVNSTDTLFVNLDITTTTIRLASRFAMSIKRLIPLTDQSCSAGLLIPGSVYPEDVVFNFHERRVDPNATVCVCSNDCVLGGESATNDGICQDYKYLTFGKEIQHISTLEYSLNSTDLLKIGNFTEGTFQCDPDGCCQWGPSGIIGNSTCLFTYPHLGERGEVLAITEGPKDGSFQRFIHTKTAGYTEGIDSCVNGTDCSDCGCSARIDPVFPKLRCEDTPLEIRFKNRNTSEHEFKTSTTISEFLGMGTKLSFSVEIQRNMDVLVRGPCGDCDGRVRCVDGTCKDDVKECETPRFDLPGDGCVRIDVTKKAFKCACALGWSGYECNKDYCSPLDPITGLGDPHEWCTCGGPNDRSFPKLKVKPPFVFVQKKGGYTARDIIKINRRRPRVLNVPGWDVGWENVQTTEKPYPFAIRRRYYQNGVWRYTNCGFYKRVPDGRLVDLEESVKTRSTTFPYQVLEWKQWPLGNGSFETYIWREETQFDEAPHRCGSTCVSDARECYRANIANPMCGGHGKCRADGSCECDSGRETFVLTDRVSRAISIPYASRNGVSDPTWWNEPDPVDYSSAVCLARNCSAVDCSAPFGCFPGTSALKFADKHVFCDARSGHPGKCALNAAACLRGEVTPTIPCSGKGILRKRDYREEWYCECGDPRSPLVPDSSLVRETVELIPNGFGGERCDRYYCTSTDYWLQRTNPQTKSAYIGNDGSRLPFIWKGPCGAPVGPRIDDIVQWQRCCPGIKRLEQCPFVPCAKGDGPNKIVSCEYAWNCLDEKSVPAVYVCNGHGRARSDGTCECEQNDREGYTHDFSVFSYRGCFKRSQCAIAKSTGTMCGKFDDCGDFKVWSEFPKVPYFEQWWQSLAILNGLPPTNQTFVDLIFNDRRSERLAYVVSQIGFTVDAAISQAAATVCVYPSEDPNNPFGMLPYDPEKMCTYNEGYKYPYLLSLSNVTSSKYSTETLLLVLTNGRFGATVSNVEEREYIRLERNTTFSDLSYVDIRFENPVRIDAIRVHARRVNMSSFAVTKFKFLGSGGLICDGDLAPVVSNDFDWIGGITAALVCAPTYTPFDFKGTFPLEWSVKCKIKIFSTACTQWMDETCFALGHTVRPPGSFLDPLTGCGMSNRCCVRKTGQFAETSSLRIEVVQPTNSLAVTIDVDEIQVYGHTNRVLPTPESLNNEIANRALPGLANTECRDAKFMLASFGSSLTYYKPRSWETSEWTIPNSTLNYETAMNTCQSSGGYLATDRGGTTATTEFASTMGTSCFTSEPETGEPPGVVGDAACLVNAMERSIPLDPAVSTFIHPDASKWGCFTPIPPKSAYQLRTVQYWFIPQPAFELTSWILNYGYTYTFQSPFDYFSTSKEDVFGNQWTTEWSPGHITVREMIHELLKESHRQKNLQMGFISFPYNQIYSPDMDRAEIKKIFERSPFLDPSYYAYYIFIQRDPMNPNVAATHYLKQHSTKRFRRNRKPAYFDLKAPTTNIPNWRDYYEDVFFDGPPVVYPYSQSESVGRWEEGRDKDPDFLPINHKQSSLKEYAVWTNPQVCILRLYTEINCGRFFRTNTCSRNTIDQDNYGNRGGKYLEYIATPANDYAGFSEITLVTGSEEKKLTNCAVYPNNNCNEVNDRSNWIFRSVSLTGPCAVEFTYNYMQGSQEMVGGKAYMEETEEKVPPSHYTTYDYQINEILKIVNYTTDWDPGCKSGSFMYYGSSEVKADQRHDPLRFKDFPTGSFEKSGGKRRDDVGACANEMVIQKFRIIPRFRSRKLHLNLRLNKLPTVPPNENDYILGYDVHPYMCSTVDVFEAGGFYPGSRFETYDVFLKPPVKIGVSQSVRFRKQSGNGFWLDHWEPLVNGSQVEKRKYIDTFVPIESMMEAVRMSADELYTNVEKLKDSTLIYPWDTCSSLGRPVRKCSECIIPQAAEWKWNPQVYNPQNVRFQDRISSMTQGPEIHVSFADRSGINTIYKRLGDLEIENPKVYARSIAVFRDPDYKRPIPQVSMTVISFTLNSCVRVDRGEIRGTYVFQPTVCEKESYKALCIRDITKYTVRSGCQCDVCGPDSRSTLYQPGATAFSLNPMAVRENFPNEHKIRDAWLVGDTDRFLSENPVPADEIAAFLLNQTQSFIGVFPGFFQALWSGWSTRANRLSRGKIQDSVAPYDFNFKAIFPHKCGRVYSKFTGESRAMCAISQEFCNRDEVYPTVEMPIADIPTSLQPIIASDSEIKKIPRCGRYVEPSTLIEFSDDQPPPPSDGSFVVVESTPAKIIIKVVRNGTVFNSRRDIGAVHNTSSFFGSVYCSNCRVKFWIGSLTNDFSQPSLKIYIKDSSGNGEFVEDSYFLANQTIRTLGWDFEASKGTTISIGRVLITDEFSIRSCRKSGIGKTFVEPPPNVDSPAPQHQCVFTTLDAERLGVDEIDFLGQCLCSPASPFGGPTCEWPAVISKHGKRICNSFDGVRLTESKWIDPEGIKRTVNTFGIAEYGNAKFACKLRTDVGSILKARLIPSSVSDFRYVVRNDDAPNRALFDFVSKEDAESQGYDVPVSGQFVNTLVGSISSILPSFSTADELQAYKKVWEKPTFVDLTLNSDLDLVWESRSEIFKYCNGLIGCNGTMMDDPCLVDAVSCEALNFNNFAFMPGNSLTDGRNVSISGSSFSVNTVTNSTTNTVDVVVLADPINGLSVKAFCPGCDILGSLCDIVVDWRTRTCNYTQVSSVQVTFDTAVNIREIGVFLTNDEARLFPFN